MLDGLKHLCEETISKQLNSDNLAEIYDLAENFNAPQLGRRCALYALEHFVVRYSRVKQHRCACICGFAKLKCVTGGCNKILMSNATLVCMCMQHCDIAGIWLH